MSSSYATRLLPPKPSVIIEYDRDNRRVQKLFTDAYAARRFYAVKLNSNKNPKVLGTSQSRHSSVSPDIKEQAMSKTTDQTTKEIRWTPIKVSLLVALNSLKATSLTTARLPDEVAKASKGVLTNSQVRFQANPPFDLTAQGIIKKTENGGIYLTAKGRKLAEKNGKLAT